MDDYKKDSHWVKDVIDQISSPWDVASAVAGGAAGLVLSTLAHFTDGGYAGYAGALAGIGARKALVGARMRKKLLNRANGLREVIEQRMQEPGVSVELASLRQRIKDQTSIFERDSTDEAHKRLSDVLNAAEARFLQISSSPILIGAAPVPAPAPAKEPATDSPINGAKPVMSTPTATGTP